MRVHLNRISIALIATATPAVLAQPWVHYYCPTRPITVTTPDDPISGDVNLDDVVDSNDLGIVLGSWGATGQVTRAQGDTNWDYTVDSQDLSNVLATWGQTRAPLPMDPNTDLRLAGGIAPVDGVITSLGDLYDDFSGAPVRIFRDRQLVDNALWKPPTLASLSPIIEATFQADGVDLVLTYTNISIEPMHPAAVRIPVFDRTVQPDYRDMKHGGMLVSPPYNTSGNWSGSMLGYPGSLYAPATVIEHPATGQTVGISVQYPILEYEQSLHFYHSDFSSAGGLLVTILPNPYNTNVVPVTQVYKEAANIQPGETRVFTVSIRVREIDAAADHAGTWMRTLRPYRRWFRGNFGGVQYARRPEQVAAGGLAQTSALSVSNPYGFTHDSTRRPDLFGFEPWRDVWDTGAATGWERMMVWQPTGLYLNNQNNNFPPQFTSQWPAILSTVMPGYDDTTGPLATYAADTGGTLGLWWGRASQIADMWDDPTLEVFDPSNTTHQAFRDNEMAGALAVNAAEVGLDAFSAGGMWQSYWTLVRDRQVYPGVRFISEPMHGDFVHTLAPSFEVMTKDPGSTTGQLYQLPEGLPIIDFLLPGHETWGMTEVRWIKVKLGYPSGASVPPEEARPFIQAVADLGLVPTYFGTGPTELMPCEFDAARTWLITVPPDLR